MRPIPRARLGRFVVGARIGAGAMGEVWSAHDPRLGRDVAIKLLRGPADGPRRRRLLREAQALARLSHPNVVQVFEAGVDHGEVFVAMERVDGPTLRTWLAAQPRTRAQILAMFDQAGRGLAAAHDVGLVHRDFKPDNVLVGADGRARVVDFGLARAGGELPAPSTSAPATEPVHAESLTETGAVLGTPAYMAPEQFLGEPVDARADQFAFCVALLEAAWGHRPFVGATRLALAAAITNGEITLPAPDRMLPPWLHAALVRGLAVDPTARYDSMHALLAALDRDPTRRRSRVLMGGAAAFAVAVPLGWLAAAHEPNPCPDGQPLVDVWDDDRRAALAESLARITPDRVAPPSVLAGLDTYAEQWSLAHRTACEASRVDPSFAVDRRMACLDRRRAALRETVDVLAHTQAASLHRVDAVVASLPTIAPCDDDAFLAAIEPIDDPAVAAALDEVQSELARGHALRSMGRLDDAHAHADAALARADALGHAGTQADALVLRGLVEDGRGELRIAEASLEAGYHRGFASGNDDAAARAALGLVELVGSDLRDDAGAQTWIRHARALVDRPTVDPVRRVQLQLDLGSVHLAHGRYDEAQAAYEHALATTPDDDPVLRDRVVSNLGAVAFERGDLAAAQYLFTRRWIGATAMFGADHLEIANDLNNLGAVAFRGGDVALAQALMERALAIRMRHLGADHPLTISTMGNLAGAHLAQGDMERAVTQLRAEIDAWGRLGEERRTFQDNARFNLSLALAELGRNDEALVPALAAVEGQREALGEAHPRVRSARRNAAELLLVLGRPAEAQVHLDVALHAAEQANADPAELDALRLVIARARAPQTD